MYSLLEGPQKQADLKQIALVTCAGLAAELGTEVALDTEVNGGRRWRCPASRGVERAARQHRHERR